MTQAGLATWYIPVCECYQRESERIKEKEGDKKGGGGGGGGGVGGYRTLAVGDLYPPNRHSSSFIQAIAKYTPSGRSRTVSADTVCYLKLTSRCS